jgi:hypothetical protein
VPWNRLRCIAFWNTRVKASCGAFISIVMLRTQCDDVDPERSMGIVNFHDSFVQTY